MIENRIGRITPCASGRRELFRASKGKPASLLSEEAPTEDNTQFVERLFAAGITDGCENCTEDVINRAQAAVLIQRYMHGAGYLPPKVKGKTGFRDVPPNYWAAAWIKEQTVEGIAVACEADNYCPDAPLTLDQMAALLVKTFGLP